jgi:hypothetical protein
MVTGSLAIIFNALLLVACEIAGKNVDKMRKPARNLMVIPWGFIITDKFSIIFCPGSGTVTTIN